MMMSQACPDPWPVSPSLAGFMPATGLLPPHLPSSQYSGSPVSASAEFWPASYPCSGGLSSGQRVDDGFLVESALIPFSIMIRDEGYNLFVLKLPSLFHKLAECQKQRICRIGLEIADELPANE
ncbi:unnamed protein product [Polarella glacialis]|uniref:Uncharacterized protein n=1 Tax=Polarella glacialis TaxID=89957 RepID=A0A813GG45_POLGL|nr:unnamed protein product [Polarella glacialis]